MVVICNNVNPTKLHDELILNGIVPLTLEEDKNEGDYVAENTWITFAEGTDMDLAQQIIDAHNPTPVATPPTELEILKQENEMLKETMDFILTELIPGIGI